MQRGTSTYILHSFLGGIVAGCIVSCCDAFYILYAGRQIPVFYPVYLLLFNCMVWSGLGVVTGIVVAKIVKKVGQHSLNWYYGCFFLPSFVLLYGLLGRLSFPVYPWKNFPQTHVYDKHLSFIFVAVLIGYRLYVLRKESRPICDNQFFVLEISFAAALYHFCSNLPSIVSSLFGRALSNIRMPLVYAVGVVVLFGLYWIGCFLKKRLIEKGVAFRAGVMVSLLLACTVLLLASAFAVNYYNNYIVLSTGISSKADSEPKRVIVIVLDTVRAESLSLYGGRAGTASLEALGRDALVFENCIAPAPWTVPSHASMFTGLHPVEHGCPVDFRSVPSDNVNFFAANPLQDEALTLAEIFKQKGFITVGISSNGLVFHPKHNLGQGFQIRDAAWGVGKIYQNSFKAPLHLFCALTGLWPQAVLSYRTADMIAAKALDVLEKAAENPIFLFVNFMDAHGPYYPPSPFAAEVLNVRFPQFERFRLFLGRYFFNRIDQKTWDVFQLAQYDAEITWIDSQLGLFFERLKQMDMYDDSLLIVTSDHGELLGEHDSYGHTTPMYDLVLRVPLIIKFPFSGQTGRVKARVGLSDIFPTILRACNSPDPHYASARPLQVHGLEDRAQVAFFLNDDFGRHLALYKDQYKYMDFQQQLPNELYDLQKDPYEKNNQVAALPDVYATMKSSLDDWLQRNHALFEMRRETSEVSDRDLEELRALGYVQ